jgi:hypothetical protein
VRGAAELVASLTASRVTRLLPSTVGSVARRSGFFNKSESIIRDIAGEHAFDNGNRRTAQNVIETLTQGDNVTSGPDSPSFVE